MPSAKASRQRLDGVARLTDKAVVFSSDELFFSLRTHVGGSAADSGKEFFAPIDNFEVRLLASTSLPGHYNGDWRVDAADYPTWRDALGDAPNLAGAGADGDANEVVEQQAHEF
ncbi:hypothetical protein [Pirellulimonas nuda]|uniref:hypothetical protein n=1 Tax=Pirellulimonas nuda TaxID=2528009 RepID=UPI0011A7B207|nr:hypothetical protein [Pirellulimonas nuda]